MQILKDAQLRDYGEDVFAVRVENGEVVLVADLERDENETAVSDYRMNQYSNSGWLITDKALRETGNEPFAEVCDYLRSVMCGGIYIHDDEPNADYHEIIKDMFKRTNDPDELNILVCENDDENTVANIVNTVLKMGNGVYIIVDSQSIIPAKFTSVWDDDLAVTTDCKINLDTFEVFAIQESKDVVPTGSLTCEYVTFEHDGKEYQGNVVPEDEFEDDDDATYFYKN